MGIFASPQYNNFLKDYVVSGCVWSGDSYGSTRAASMTAGVVCINGFFISVAAVSARTFTASRDVYVDIDSTGTLVYTDNTTNAASPALAANSIRIAIVVVGASSIANVAAINQGQQYKLLPIASSTPYAVTDSLGNLICPRDPDRSLLGYRQTTSTFTTTSTTQQQVTALSVPVIVPTDRRIKISGYCDTFGNSAASTNVAVLKLWDGTVGSGTQLSQTNSGSGSATAGVNGFVTPLYFEVVTTPSSATKTYNLGLNINVSGTANYSTVATPSFLKVELA